MVKFWEKYWTPRLRSIVKRVTKDCHTCKRFRAIAVANPPAGNLPRDGTEGNTALQVVGVDYAGPIKYLQKNKREGKAYVILYACSLTRATYLELLPNQETSEFLRSFATLGYMWQHVNRKAPKVPKQISKSDHGDVLWNSFLLQKCGRKTYEKQICFNV